ncbi:MAG TPA: hypothetical protein VME23_05900 [Terracidiphilus sp.]|nr:hypothetical protein [Terracidiphilus sp.]
MRRTHWGRSRSGKSARTPLPQPQADFSMHIAAVSAIGAGAGAGAVWLDSVFNAGGVVRWQHGAWRAALSAPAQHATAWFCPAVQQA